MQLKYSYYFEDFSVPNFLSGAMETILIIIISYIVESLRLQNFLNKVKIEQVIIISETL